MPISDFSVGEEATMKITVDEDAVEQFIALSGDDAPLHTDEAYATAQGFERRLVHGALLAAYISRFVGTTFPGKSSLLMRFDLTFRSPCYAPCVIIIKGQVRQVSEATDTLIVNIEVFDEASGEAAVTGKTYHKILSKGPDE